MEHSEACGCGFCVEVGKPALIRHIEELELESVGYMLDISNLRCALEKYGRHLDGCKLLRADMTYRHPRNCVCGLGQALGK